MERKIPRLGVNIDHVATVRQARQESYPSVLRAAREVLGAGAQQITVHLREDRRHIQDGDLPPLRELTRECGGLLNLEMGCADDILERALGVGPDWVCLVPERRQERTTEGGLDLLDGGVFERVGPFVEVLKSRGIKVSLFVEARAAVLERALELGPGAVEIHTGPYARDFGARRALDGHLRSYEMAQRMCAGVPLHAGHGLTAQGLGELLRLGIFEEFNVGHWIVSEAIFSGLKNVVMDLLEKFRADY